MSNLGLFSGPGGPAYNQSQMMNENDLKDQMSQEQINQMRLMNSQSEAMNPLLQQQQDLINQFKTNQNRGEGGLADQHVAAGDVAKAGTQDTVDSNHQAALTKMGSEGVKQMQNLGEAFGQAGSTISQLGAGPHTAAITKSVFDKLNIPEDSGLRQAVLALPPEDMGAKLIELSKQMALHTGTHVQQQDALGTKQQTAFGVQNIKTDSAESIASAKIEAQSQWKTLDNDTKLKIASEANDLKKFLLQNKVINTDQLVAKATQEYQAAPTEANKAALEQATQIKAYTNGAQGKLIEAYAKGDLTQSVLGGPNGMAPNTRPAPIQGGPVSGFPVGTVPPAPSVTQPSAPVLQQAAPVTAAPVEETDPNKVTDAQIVARLSADPRWKGHPPADMIAAFRAKYRK